MDEIYMRRALELAALGCGYVSPNPMVGAVIVGPDGRVIGEGWHRRYGGWHAEVNAVSSVRPSDEHLLEKSTIMSPLSHVPITGKRLHVPSCWCANDSIE